MTKIRRMAEDQYIALLLHMYVMAPDHVRRKDVRRLTKMRRKSIRAYRNPTPLLQRLRADATFLVQQLGREQALQAARTMTADTRRNTLLMRMIERSTAKKLRKRPVRKTMYDKLLSEFGTTDAMSARGFILEDGSCLNLGQYDDHRIINCVYPDSDKAEERYGSRYGAFKNLCKKYNMIRWIPESKMLEIFVPTTRDQDRTIMDLADSGKLREVEVHRPRGGTVMLEAEDGETLVRGINAILG